MSAENFREKLEYALSHRYPGLTGFVADLSPELLIEGIRCNGDFLQKKRNTSISNCKSIR